MNLKSTKGKTGLLWPLNKSSIFILRTQTFRSTMCLLKLSSWRNRASRSVLCNEIWTANRRNNV